VIVLTAYGDWTTYMDAMDTGAADYMNKPVRREEILLAARKALARRGIRPPEARGPGQARSASEPEAA
jgi:DNA-binding NtrC family response regulator